MKKHIHVVPHQHFDLVWRRELQWYRNRRQQLFLQILALLRRCPQSRFTFSQAIAMREFLGQHPECRNEVSELLQTGRLEIIGGSESICDLNMVSGSAIMRNLEMGRQWFLDELGYAVKVGAFEDAFGLSQQIAQVTKLANYDFYKADRVPLADGSSVRGDFIWETTTGESLHCVNPHGELIIWGWGESDYPDELITVLAAEKRRKLYDHLAKAARFPGENNLFTIVGEEQSVSFELPGILEKLNREFDVCFRFSTFSEYYRSLPPDYWEKVPRYSADSDFSRTFTGCYSSRRSSKTNAKTLETSLLRAEMNAALDDRELQLSEQWRTLFMLQFHDAICGCHIDENARQLQQMRNQALKKVPIEPAYVPWQPVLPEISLSGQFENLKIAEGTLNFENYVFQISNGRLENICCNGRDLGALCNLVLREEHGTLWTEEYSGREYCFDAPEKILKITRSANILEIITEDSVQSLERKLWVGLAKIHYRKHYRFFAGHELCGIKIDLDFLGNSTEVSLRWNCADLEYCTAEIPFGSVRRNAYEPSENFMTGCAFPALSWVKCDNFVIFNRAVPSHAIRKKRLENILLRSPVKGWSPWFPLTPSDSSHDNGHHSFCFLRGGSNFVRKNNAELHRAGMEFNLGAIEYKFDGRLERLPENVVIASCRNESGKLHLLLFEADGKTAHWKNAAYKIDEDFAAYEIKILKV